MSSIASSYAPTQQVNAVLTIELTTPVDDNRPIFIVGNFNNWTVDDPLFKLHRLSHGKFMFSFPKDTVLPARLEYKYVRGGWENKELDDFGSTTENRVLENPKNLVHDYVPRWSNYGLTFNPFYLPKIKVIEENFYMPQLKKNRKVSVLLPYNYDKNPQKRYPVLYLQDGQNLFNPQSPYGNWAIDHKLAVLAERGIGDVIIIAIDHAGDQRVNEFLPIANAKIGTSAEGKKYVRFIADTLKPFVDTQFRTLPDRLHTGIGGSSLGGLISIYAGLMYPSAFGRLLVFSPSLWVTQNVSFENISFKTPLPTKIYTYAGGREGASMIPNVKRFRDNLKNKGFKDSEVNFKLVIDPQGAHSEMRWGQEFPKAVEWMFFY